MLTRKLFSYDEFFFTSYACLVNCICNRNSVCWQLLHLHVICLSLYKCTDVLQFFCVFVCFCVQIKHIWYALQVQTHHWFVGLDQWLISVFQFNRENSFCFIFCKGRWMKHLIFTEASAFNKRQCFAEKQFPQCTKCVFDTWHYKQSLKQFKCLLAEGSHEESRAANITLWWQNMLLPLNTPCVPAGRISVCVCTYVWRRDTNVFEH